MSTEPLADVVAGLHRRLPHAALDGLRRAAVRPDDEAAALVGRLRRLSSSSDDPRIGELGEAYLSGQIGLGRLLGNRQVAELLGLRLRP